MGWYEHHYGKLFIVPVALLLISIFLISQTTMETGSFVRKGVSLQGGVSVTLQVQGETSAQELLASVEQEFPGADVRTRVIDTGAGPAYIIEAADIHEDTQAAADRLTTFLQQNYIVESISVETTGPSLGDAFFIQTILGILLAFLWMGWVVYLYFGENTGLKVLMAVIALTATVLVLRGVLSGGLGILILAGFVLASMVIYFISSVPSGAVILAAASTIAFTLAVIDVIGLRLSTAGVAAFLMLIGYSVDTDILLSTRLLKERTGTLYERMVSAFKTGITMQLTTTAAVLAALLLSSSEVIQQIMLIILIGMVGDVIFTWLQNAGILFWHVERLESSGKRRRR